METIDLRQYCHSELNGEDTICGKSNYSNWCCWYYFLPLPDVKVKDFVRNITQLRLDIGSSVNISEETVNTLLEASVSHSEVKDQKEVSD